MSIHEATIRARSAEFGPAGSHIPVLAATLATARPGPVVELGVGTWSSMLLAEMCRATGRKLLCLDQDPHWLATFGDLPAERRLIRPYPSLDWYLDMEVAAAEGPYAVAFIDHSPAAARLPAVVRLRAQAEYIVIHDTDNASGDLDDLLEYLRSFPYRYRYRLMRPHTTVVSDTRAYPAPEWGVPE
jgi:predicted O-methyltransferase YrrM